jgi:phosphotransferase system HPr (HPr) family protein
MREASVTVLNQLGLHARAAAQLVRLANEFKSRILIHRRDTNSFADAKSILSILTLAASMGTTLLITVDGEDSEAALTAVQDLFLGRFGEN